MKKLYKKIDQLMKLKVGKKLSIGKNKTALRCKTGVIFDVDDPENIKFYSFDEIKAMVPKNQTISVPFVHGFNVQESKQSINKCFNDVIKALDDIPSEDFDNHFNNANPFLISEFEKPKPDSAALKELHEIRDEIEKYNHKFKNSFENNSSKFCFVFQINGEQKIINIDFTPNNKIEVSHNREHQFGPLISEIDFDGYVNNKDLDFIHQFDLGDLIFVTHPENYYCGTVHPYSTEFGIDEYGCHIRIKGRFEAHVKPSKSFKSQCHFSFYDDKNKCIYAGFDNQADFQINLIETTSLSDVFEQFENGDVEFIQLSINPDDAKRLKKSEAVKILFDSPITLNNQKINNFRAELKSLMWNGSSDVVLILEPNESLRG